MPHVFYSTTPQGYHMIRMWWQCYRQQFGEDAYRYVKGLLEMAGIGKRFNFHGSFSSKAAAMKKEAETPGAFIRERTVSGKLRYFVLTPKGIK